LAGPNPEYAGFETFVPARGGRKVLQLKAALPTFRPERRLLK
jgi:hypothetical protein